MNKQEFLRLTDVNEKKKIINIEDLTVRTDRTLLYGYTCDRESWHVYIKNEEIVVVSYGFSQTPEIIEVESNYGFVPDKRLYPERCDYEFSRVLLEKGIGLPFTTWTDDIEVKKYYGEVIQ